MEKYEIKAKQINLHNILYAITTEQDYEMTRWILLENMPDTKYDEYIIVEGGHCSCYDFDDTTWDAIKYTSEELIEVAKHNLKNKSYYKEEKDLFEFILNYFGEKLGD